jgi:hypothetical protein
MKIPVASLDILDSHFDTSNAAHLGTISVKMTLMQTDTQDAEQLDNLSLAFKVVGALHAVCVNVFWFHVIAGIAVMNAESPSRGEMPIPQDLFGGVFVLVSLSAIVFGITVGVLTWRAGTFLADRKNHTYCVVLSAVNLLFQPIGLILGILALIVLNRPSVKAIFERKNT